MIRVGSTTKLICYAFLLAYAAVIVFPLTMIVFNSFKTMRDLYLKPFSFPQKFDPDNIITAWREARIGIGYKNSVIITLASVGAVILFASMFAYAVSKYAFPGRRALFTYILLGLALPARLAVVPLFFLLKQLNLLDTHIGLVLTYTAVNLPFATLVLKNFIDNIPNELLEAAKIDGATPFHIYRTIIVPLIIPAVSIVCIVTFVNVWNDFFFPLVFLSDRNKATITLAVSIFFSEYSTRWDMLFASLTLAIAPSILLYILLSRYFVAGVTAGAIK